MDVEESEKGFSQIELPRHRLPKPGRWSWRSVLLAGVAAAASEDQSVTVCSRMLEASLPRPASTARPFRIQFLNRGHVDTEAAYSAGEFTYDLRALEAGSGREVVTASCTVQEDGQVISMRFEPRAAVAPTFASR